MSEVCYSEIRVLYKMQPMTKKLYALVPDKNGWRTMSNGAKVWLGLNVEVNETVTIGTGTMIGNEVKIGDGSRLVMGP